MPAPTANDVAWKRFFDSTAAFKDIERLGYTYVAANDLRRYGQREPRLMAKLDTISQRPQVFEEHGLNILPVENGRYIIFKDPKNKCYYRFPADELDGITIEQYTSSIDLQSLHTFPQDRSFSESQAIDFAYLASLLRHFCGCDVMHLTVRGRLFSGQFNFQLPDLLHTVQVSNVQIEVDSGYETDDSIILIEAKISRRDDFHVRQLYYPYLQWCQRSGKQVRLIFLTYSNAEYILTEFRFGDCFSELELVRSRAFVINDTPVAVIDLPELLKSVPLAGEPPGIPFPQADDMDKVVDVVQLISKGINQKSQIAEFFDFDERQADYYANAAAYLGFLARKHAAGEAGRAFGVTPAGRTFLSQQSRSDRTRSLLRALLERPTFRQGIELLYSRGLDLDHVTTADLASIIGRHTSLTGTTPRRRASTVWQWLKWVVKNSNFPTRA